MKTLQVILSVKIPAEGEADQKPTVDSTLALLDGQPIEAFPFVFVSSGSLNIAVTRPPTSTAELLLLRNQLNGFSEGFLTQVVDAIATEVAKLVPTPASPPAAPPSEDGSSGLVSTA